MRRDGVVLWWTPLAVFAAGMAWLVGLGGDFLVADRLYALEGGRWALRSHWLTEALLHDAARNACVLAFVVVLVAWVASLCLPRARRWRRPLGYLVLAVATSTLLVAAIKATSPLGCPWDLARYGGAFDTATWPGRCFPAGHASAGYAWLALYFFLLAVRPAWRLAGLAAGLGLGLVFGVVQQLRGAHFLSHDLVTALVCWTVALGLSRPVLRLPAEGRTA